MISKLIQLNAIVFLFVNICLSQYQINKLYKNVKHQFNVGYDSTINNIEKDNKGDRFTFRGKMDNKFILEGTVIEYFEDGLIAAAKQSIIRECEGVGPDSESWCEDIDSVIVTKNQNGLKVARIYMRHVDSFNSKYTIGPFYAIDLPNNLGNNALFIFHFDKSLPLVEDMYWKIVNSVKQIK